MSEKPEETAQSFDFGKKKKKNQQKKQKKKTKKNHKKKKLKQLIKKMEMKKKKKKIHNQVMEKLLHTVTLLIHMNFWQKEFMN